MLSGFDYTKNETDFMKLQQGKSANLKGMDKNIYHTSLWYEH